LNIQTPENERKINIIGFSISKTSLRIIMTGNEKYIKERDGWIGV
jgi:hypothetical protein